MFKENIKKGTKTN